MLNEKFRKFAGWSSEVMGSSWAFIFAVLLLVAWVCSRRLFNSFDTWQLIINTGTTIITFLMVFLIQNTQNRDAKAIHLKLDELIRSTEGARNRLVDLESLSDEELARLKKQFEDMTKRGEDCEQIAEVQEVHEEISEEQVERQAERQARQPASSDLRSRPLQPSAM